MKIRLITKYLSRMLVLNVLAFCIFGCQFSGDSHIKPASQGSYAKINGKTMGTTYQVTYLDINDQVKASQIDSILIAINQSVSTYIPKSLISNFNNSNDGLTLRTLSQNHDIGKHLVQNLEVSRMIYTQSNGLFDPTIMPLVNYWGFGYKGRQAHDIVESDTIFQMLGYVGLDLVFVENEAKETTIKKTHPNTELDFSASAKGYAVDEVMQYLIDKKVQHAYVEIGGEVKTIGKNPKGSNWTIGINTPDPSAPLNDFEQIIAFSGMALASSGNYRNFHTVNGQKYGHEINPKTGYPIQTEVLSASVLAPTCQIADGLATACMMMQTEKIMELIESLENTEVLLITAPNGGGYEHVMSSGFVKYVVD